MSMKNSFKLIKLVVLLYRVCKFVYVFISVFDLRAPEVNLHAWFFSSNQSKFARAPEGVNFVAFSEYMNFKISEMYDRRNYKTRILSIIIYFD